MPYAFLNPDGTIKQIIAKPSPFMRLGEGERMVNYNPPAFDAELELLEVVYPIEELDVQFLVTPMPPEVTQPILERRKSQAVQAHLDDTAQAHGYDSILAAASYAGSPVYGLEGSAFRDWRDACWAELFQILAAVAAGERPMPADDELLTELPAFNGGTS